jgi:HSP20 family protein
VSMEKMQNDVLRAFNDSCVISTRSQYRGRGFKPAADAYYEEKSREIVVRFELPGMERDDIELFIDRRELVVRGERSFPTAGGRVYQQVEMDYGPFERHVRLMVDVEPDSSSAVYEAGILEVRLTLAEREGARRIQITSTEEGEE